MEKQAGYDGSLEDASEICFKDLLPGFLLPMTDDPATADVLQLVPTNDSSGGSVTLEKVKESNLETMWLTTKKSDQLALC